MTYSWMDLAEQQAEEAVRKLTNAENILRNAQKAFEKDPSRINRIALKAAERLAKETLAEAEEWITDA